MGLLTLLMEAISAQLGATLEPNQEMANENVMVAGTVRCFVAILGKLKV